MLARILFITLAVTTAFSAFSQDELGTPKLKHTNYYWSIGYYASGNLSLINGYTNNKAPQPGYGAALELTYNDSKRDLMLILSKNKINSKQSNRYIDVVEFTIGPRFNLNKSGDIFTEFTLGSLIISRVSKNYLWEYNIYDEYTSSPQFCFGLTGGFGKKISINNNTSLLFKLRLLTSIAFENELVTYLTASAGITFNTKKDTLANKKIRNTYVSIALFGGANNPAMLSQWSYDWGICYGAEFTYYVSPKVELLLDGNYNSIRYSGGQNFQKSNLISLTTGGRFLINQSPAAAFIEVGGRLYNYSYHYKGTVTGEEYDYSNDTPGINFGTGTKLRINKFFDFLLRGNLHFIFSEKYDDTPNFLSVQGGVRLNL